MPDISQTCAAIELMASQLSLVVFTGMPGLDTLAAVTYTGEWDEFLQLGSQVGAKILYLSERRYDPDARLQWYFMEHDESNPTALSPTESRLEQIWNKVGPTLSEWDVYRGDVMSIECCWIKDGVGHVWERSTEWAGELEAALENALALIEQLGQEELDETIRERERIIDTYAREMATHPRFPEATNEAKRLFMARQLFPNNIEAGPFVIRHRDIVDRAIAYHWWKFGPFDKFSSKH